MKYWITPDGSYYEGEFVAEGSIAVSKRPSQFHIYVNDEWIYSAELKRASMLPLSAFQVRKVLTQFGLRANVEAAILQADQATKDAWQYANEFYRNNPILLGMAQALSITDEQLDAMFEQGVLL